MALTEEQMRLREGKLTASAIGALVSGDPGKVMNLWRQMVGDPAFEGRDWDRFWPARLGSITETLSLEWYGYTTGRPVKRCGEVVVHPQYDWAAATLDGFDDGLVGPVECKHVGGWEPRSAIIARYMAQVHWQMDVTGTKRAAMSIIEGAKEPAVEIVEWNADYSAELWRRAEAFMQSVWSLTPPIALPEVTVPVPAVREYDFTGRNEWAAHAGMWAENKAAAKAFDGAAKSLRSLIPADAARCFGHGVEATRDKANRITIKECAI